MQITKITGITKGNLAGEEVPSFPEAARQMEAFVESRRAALDGSPEVVMVAHNGRRFDSQFLKAEYLRADMEMPKWKYLDTLGLSRRVLGGKDSPRPPPMVSFSIHPAAPRVGCPSLRRGAFRGRVVGNDSVGCRTGSDVVTVCVYYLTEGMWEGCLQLTALLTALVPPTRECALFAHRSH